MSERITPEQLDYIADMTARTGNYAAAVSFRRAAATIRELEADTRRLDWLVWNGWVGRLCDEDSYNPDDGDAVLAAHRAAIDAAIALTPEEPS
jgi:hypothetical protein